MPRRTPRLCLATVLIMAVWVGAAAADIDIVIRGDRGGSPLGEGGQTQAQVCTSSSEHRFIGDEPAPEARFQIGVATDRTTYAPGEPVEIVVTVANPDGWLVEYSVPCPCCWYLLEIVDSADQVVAYELDDLSCFQIPWTYSWPAYETRITDRGSWWQTVGEFEFGETEGTAVPAGEYWVRLDWPGVTVVRSQKFRIAEPEAVAPRAWVLPAVVYAEGVNGTFWSSDVILTNAGTTDSAVTMSLFLRGASSVPIVRSIDLTAGRSEYLWRLLPLYFQAEGAGHLHIATVGGEVIVEGRVVNGRNIDEGTVAQRIDAVAVDQGMTAAILTGLHHSPDGNLGYRSNIGVVNLSADSLRVDIELYSSYSTAPIGTPMGAVPLELPPFGSRQLTDIYRLVGDESVVSGSAIVRLGEYESGTFAAYASVIDNLTGDAIFVPAKRCGH